MEEEEGRNRANGEIRKNITSVQTPEDRRQGGFTYEQANVPKNSNVGLKREVKFDVPPPGLTYGEAEQSFFNQSSKDLHQQTKPLGDDADSMMTDVNTTHNQKQR